MTDVSTLADWRQRVIEEEQALRQKMVALRAFIENVTLMPALPQEEQRRLRRQLAAMEQYHQILLERIMAFQQGATQ